MKSKYRSVSLKERRGKKSDVLGGVTRKNDGTTVDRENP